MIEIILSFLAIIVAIQIVVGIAYVLGFVTDPTLGWPQVFWPPRWLVFLILLVTAFLAASIFFDFPIVDIFPPLDEGVS